VARVKETEPRTADADDLVNQAKEYAFVKKQIEYLEKQKKDLHAKLFEKIDGDGFVDDKGNVILELPTEVDGYVSVMKQRRVSRKINEDKAADIIYEHGLQDSLYKTVIVVDEDALMAALYEGVLTEAEIDEMYPQSVVWALVMNKR